MQFPQIQLDIFPSLFIYSVVNHYREDGVYRNFGVCIHYLTVIKTTLLSLFVSRGALHDKKKTAVRVACVAGGIVWLKFLRRSRVPKNRIRDEVNGISRGFAAHDCSAVKSHSTILQWLRRQISLDYYTIPPATQATVRETKTTCHCSRCCHIFDLEMAAENSLNFNYISMKQQFTTR